MTNKEHLHSFTYMYIMYYQTVFIMYTRMHICTCRSSMTLVYQLIIKVEDELKVGGYVRQQIH